MGATSLQELFVEELRDAYDAEKRLTKALPRMAKAAESTELQAAFTNHLRETERQIQRLEQVFRTVGEPVRAKKCDGVIGIIEESKTAMEEVEEGPVLDAALIAGAQRVEHYEIAAYGTLAYFAELLGNEKAKDLLGQTLEEEKAADEKLSMIAKAKVNREALMGSGMEEDEEQDEEEEDQDQESSSRSGRGGGRGVTAMRQGQGSRGSSGRASASDRSRSSNRGGSGGSRRSR